MTEIRYWTQLATEQFTPSDLIQQAVEVENAGFDGLNVSDHYQPWWEPGEAGHAWVLLGAIGQATERIPIGTGVTAPVYRHNPAVMAQAFATLEQMFPGRAFLGIGSGESLNESPCGMDWPPVREQIDRMEEGLDIIGGLFDGERLDYEGRFFRTKAAYLHTRGERRPPIYISAFGKRAAGVAARYGDGVWTLADPEQAPIVVDAYKSACDDAGKEPGEIILQAGSSWAPDDDAALEGARVWKGAQPPEYFTDDWHDPKAMYEKAEKGDLG
jgi:coenzyme F420-dependent glucose-6-phosphate dehydrogenase